MSANNLDYKDLLNNAPCPEVSVDDMAMQMIDYARRMEELANTITEHGRPLLPSEREMIRMAYSGLFRDMLATATSNFINGDMLACSCSLLEAAGLAKRFWD
jgi:hypothetical protein